MTVLSMVPKETPFLPPKVTEIAKETLRNFPHSKKVGNYLLGNTLGEGSFAKVKEALHIPTGERVAVKIIDKKKSREDSYVRKNLRREGKILQMIRHCNIVQLLEIMETQNSYYLVTELCRGGDLMDYISQRRRIPEQEVKKYIRQIVSAVDYLHRQGILHRDLKIENLLLDEFHDIKIIDFGLSNCIKVVQTKEGVKAQEYCVTQCGSPAYAAPELLGRRKYGPQVDIWSIGVNMYAMLTGNLPFTVEPFNIKSLHNKMVNSQMNPLPEGVTRECRDLIRKFLNPDPDRRIRLDDVMKHPWIANGTSNPMSRAPCPNKLKTETLDNSILKHMSENQGFRLGEIIRFVTGNVPSSATAMYHLFHRKLRKYVGNLKASGKIAADNRLLNRTQQVVVMQMNNKHQTTKTAPIKTAHIPNDKQISTVANKTVPHERIASSTKPSNEGGKNNHPQIDNDDAEDFTDILAVRNKNDGIQMPRAKSPVRGKADGQTKTIASPYLPNVAKKYMYSHRRNTLHSAIERSELKHKQLDDTSTSLGTENLKDKVIENSSPEDEPFRERASTFPGKIQRPKVDLQKLIKQRVENDNEFSENLATLDSKTSARNNDNDNNDNNNNIRRFQKHQAGSPVKARRYSVHREETTSQSPQPRQKSPSPYYVSNVKRPYQRRMIGTGQPKPKPGDEIKIPSPEPESRMSPTRQYLTRPVISNKIVRAQVENKQEYKQEMAVDEQVSEISSGSTRQSSSRNTSGSVASNAGSAALPSISPINAHYKRNS